VTVEVLCPYCGEPLTLSVDESGGRRQVYVEDCAVCCQPIEVRARVTDDEFDIDVRRLDD
jgi:Cysteine-rich CPXCG